MCFSPPSDLIPQMSWHNPRSLYEGKKCESLDDVINVYIGVNKFQQIMNPSVSVPFSYIYFQHFLLLSLHIHTKSFLPCLFSMPVSCLFAKFIFLTAFDYNPCAIQRAQSLCLLFFWENLCEVVRKRGKKNLRSFSHSLLSEFNEERNLFIEFISSMSWWMFWEVNREIL